MAGGYSIFIHLPDYKKNPTHTRDEPNLLIPCFHLIFEHLKLCIDSVLFSPQAKDVKEKNHPDGTVSGK